MTAYSLLLFLGGVALGHLYARWVWRHVKKIRSPVDGSRYLTRWTLVHLFGHKLMLHKMHRPDYSQCEHDHPWWFVSFVVWNGYGEYVRGAYRWNRPGALLWRGPGFEHRIASLVRVRKGYLPCWTLVLRGRTTRVWGFVKRLADGARQWRPWADYDIDWCGDR